MYEKGQASNDKTCGPSRILPLYRAELLESLQTKKKAVDIVILGKPTKLHLVFLQDKLENTPDQRSILSPTYLRY